MTPKDREDRWPAETSGCKGMDCDKKENCLRYKLYHDHADDQVWNNYSPLNACQWMRDNSPIKNPYPYFIVVDIEKEWKMKYEATA